MIRRLLCLLTLAWFAPAFAAPDIPAARHLAEEAARAAGKGAVLVVFYTRNACPYCVTVRRDYLNPLLQRGDPRVRVVEINIEQERPLHDFAGALTTPPRFAAEQNVRLVPAVAFHGPGGQRLAKPIVGALLADFYPAYLEKAITDSLAELQGKK